MKALALRTGYYINRIVEEGETFDLVEPHTKGLWFRLLDAPTEKVRAVKPGKAVPTQGGGDLA